MVLPLLVPLAIGAAGLYGGGKTVKAVSDSSDAKQTNTRARNLADKTNGLIEAARAQSNENLELLGEKKLAVQEEDLARFVSVFSKIKNVEISSNNILPENIDHEIKSPDTIVEDCSFLATSSRGILSGATAVTLSAYGAYSGTMMLAASGTGTSISALSGAAASNATLAWLGGGTLASGGFGVAGGTLVLGTLAAGPALLIFGSVLGAKASRSLSDARSNLETAKTFESQGKVVVTKLEGIDNLTTLSLNTLSKVRSRLRRARNRLSSIQRESGTDYRFYSEEQQNEVFLAIKYAQLIKVLVDKPILDENGDVVEESRKQLNEIHKEIQG